MELYNFYSMGSMISSFFYGNDYKQILISGAISGVVIWLVLFVLQSFGLLAMAKRLNMRNRWLAFVPFANIFYLGKIVGTCQFFGQKMKNAGLYAMIAQILATILTVAYIAAEVFLIWNYQPMVTETGTLYWVGLTGFAKTVNAVYEIGMYLMSLVSLVAQILLIILMTGVFKKYSPRNYRMLSVITFIFPLVRFIAIFVLRNREPFDYDEYMRRQREEYMRRQQQYYNTYGNGGPYGNNGPYGGNGGYYGGRGPYGNGGYGSPYGMGGYQGAQQNPQPPQEEPFGEFDEGKKNGGSSNGASGNTASSEGGNTGDGFFD